MEEITKDNLSKWIKEIVANNEPFDCEYDFQFNLALELKNKIPDLKIGFEKKIYNDKRSRCDLVLTTTQGVHILIELKYVYTNNQSDKRTLNSRKTFIKDYKRIENTIKMKHGYTGFVFF